MSDLNNSIQLQCSLCPKNPKFSDISHLLTHISSKSHLSHRFKLQIRSQSEIAAKKQLDDFDIWYHNNNLDVLLSERLASKEQKISAKEKRSRLSNVSVKKENQPERETSLSANPVFRAPMPRMHLWPTTTNTSASTPISDWEQSAEYATPTTRREIPNFTRQETPAGDPTDPLFTTPWKPKNDEDEKADEKIPDSAKLKGVYWPGMDLFDSATPEMKRMRNQRKDSSILDQMMATSAEVEPNEISYNADGGFRACRNIFGPLSTETSPVRIEAPTPKKRKTRKLVLADLSVNAPRLRASRSKKVIVTASPEKRPTSPRHNVGTSGAIYNPKPMTVPNPLGGFGRKYFAATDEVDEFRMTADDMSRKRSFNIFQDAPEESPGRTESPMEEHRFDFPGSTMHLYTANSSNSTSHISPTPLRKPTSFRVFGKENGQPEMPAQFQPRRSVAASLVFPPQAFYEPTFNPLYANPYARSFPYGDHQSNHNQEMKPPTGYPSSFQGDFRPLNPVPIPRNPRSYGQAMGSSNGGGASGNMQYGI